MNNNVPLISSFDHFRITPLMTDTIILIDKYFYEEHKRWTITEFEHLAPGDKDATHPALSRNFFIWLVNPNVEVLDPILGTMILSRKMVEVTVHGTTVYDFSRPGHAEKLEKVLSDD